MNSSLLLTHLLETKSLPQAMILQGNMDVSAQLLNLHLQKFICESNNACGSCQHCQLLQHQEHPDIILVKAPPGHPIKIEQIRELHTLTQQSSHSLDFKLVILHHAESMNLFASNALLKILEEPLSKVHFILLVEHPKLLPKTILSRCWHLRTIEEHPLHISEMHAFDINDVQSQLLAQDVTLKIQLLDFIQGKIDLMTCVSIFVNHPIDDVLWYLQWMTQEVIQELVLGHSSQLPIELTSVLPLPYWWKFWDRIEYYKKQLRTQPNLQLNLLFSELFSILLVYDTSMGN